MIDHFSNSITGLNTKDMMRKHLRTLLAIAGLALLAFAISQLILRMDIYYAILAIITVIAGIIISRRFEAGVLALFFIAPFNKGNSPQLLGPESATITGFTLSLIGLMFLIAFWVGSNLFGDGLKLVKTKLNRPLLIFAMVAAASIISASIIWDKDIAIHDKQHLYQITEAGLWILCGLAFILTANSMKSKPWITALYWPLVLIGLYVSYFQITEAEMPLRITRAIFIPDFAAILTIARLFFGKERTVNKVGFALLLIIFLFAAFSAREWVSGWITAGIGVTAVILFYSRRLFVVMAVVLLLGIIISPQYINAVYSESHQEGDLDRLGMWTDAFNMAVNVNPMLGIGPGDYIAYSRKYGSIWYGYTTYTTAHSDYAQMIAEMGFAGILAFLGLIIGGIRTGLDAVKSSSKNIRWFTIGATSVFASIALTSLVGDYLLPSRVNGGIWSFGTSIYPWLLLGAAVAASHPEKQLVEAES
jgi:O-antigen ligase